MLGAARLPWEMVYLYLIGNRCRNALFNVELIMAVSLRI